MRGYPGSPYYYSTGPLQSRPSTPNNKNTGYMRQHDFWLDEEITAAARERERRQRKIEQFQSNCGEYIATSPDGTQWFIVPLRENQPRGKCVINRLSPKGYLIIEEKVYNNRFQAIRAAEDRVRKERSRFENREYEYGEYDDTEEDADNADADDVEKSAK